MIWNPKRSVLAVLLLCLLIAPVAMGQRLTADRTLHDFGYAQDGDVVKCEFTLSNTGTADITINRVSYNCSCTSFLFLLDNGRTQRTPYTVPAGGAVTMEVTFRTRGYASRSQPVSQVLTIRSDDPERPMFTVTIQTNVVTSLPSHLGSPSTFAEEHVFLLDLRSAEAFSEGHLFGAIHVPFEALSDWLPRLPKDHMYMLYDSDGSLAAQAATRMSNEGYWGYAYFIAGGLARWRNDLGMKFFTGPQAALPPASAGAGVGLLSKLPASVASKYRVVIDLSAASAFAQSRVPGSVNMTEQEAVTWVQTLPQLLGLSTVSEVTLWVLDDGDGSAACRVAQQLLDMGLIASCIQGGRAALLADTGGNFLWAVSDE